MRRVAADAVFPGESGGRIGQPTANVPIIVRGTLDGSGDFSPAGPAGISRAVSLSAAVARWCGSKPGDHGARLVRPLRRCSGKRADRSDFVELSTGTDLTPLGRLIVKPVKLSGHPADFLKTSLSADPIDAVTARTVRGHGRTRRHPAVFATLFSDEPVVRVVAAAMCPSRNFSCSARSTTARP